MATTIGHLAEKIGFLRASAEPLLGLGEVNAGLLLRPLAGWWWDDDAREALFLFHTQLGLSCLHLAPNMKEDDIKDRTHFARTLHEIFERDYGKAKQDGEEEDKDKAPPVYVDATRPDYMAELCLLRASIVPPGLFFHKLGTNARAGFVDEAAVAAAHQENRKRLERHDQTYRVIAEGEAAGLAGDEGEDDPPTLFTTFIPTEHASGRPLWNRLFCRLVVPNSDPEELRLIASPDWPHLAVRETSLGRTSPSGHPSELLMSLVGGRTSFHWDDPIMRAVEDTYRWRPSGNRFDTKFLAAKELLPVHGAATAILASRLVPSRKLVAVGADAGQPWFLTRYQNDRLVLTEFRPSSGRMLEGSLNTGSPKRASDTIQRIQARTPQAHDYFQVEPAVDQARLAEELKCYGLSSALSAND